MSHPAYTHSLLLCCSTCRWHDAGTYDAKTKTGGANGSIRFEEECNHGANAGLKIAMDLLGMHIIYES
jgi:catalase (peroxidase I)